MLCFVGHTVFAFLTLLTQILTLRENICYKTNQRKTNSEQIFTNLNCWKFRVFIKSKNPEKLTNVSLPLTFI